MSGPLVATLHRGVPSGDVLKVFGVAVLVIVAVGLFLHFLRRFASGWNR